MEHKTVSLADQVFERLEADILSGRYQKGELLTELRLVADLGVSRTPIREALRRLEQDRFVRLTQKGMEILGIGREELDDIFAVRQDLEGLAAAKAAESALPRSLEELREVLELQEFYAARKDATRICELDGRFHRLLYECSGSQVLRDILLPLHKKVQRYRLSSVEEPERAHESIEEHRAIYEALAARDRKAATDAAKRHIQRAGEHILKKA